MIYRVKFKSGYCENFFDFSDADEALEFMKNAIQKLNSGLSSENELKITMMIVEEKK